MHVWPPQHAQPRSASVLLLCTGLRDRCARLTACAGTQAVAARRRTDTLDRVSAAFEEAPAARGGSVLSSQFKRWQAGSRKPLPEL